MADSSTRRVPTAEDMEWDCKMDACKRALCVVYAPVVGNAALSKMGTGWVVRNDTVSALVTALHVLDCCLHTGADGEVVVKAGVEAVFVGGRHVLLAGARALWLRAAGGGAASVGLDVVLVVLAGSGRRFPVPPVPCLLDVTSAEDVGGGGEYSLLHHPQGVARLVVHPRGRLLVAPPAGSARPDRPGMVCHRAPTAGGSSGGMLVDHRCRGFAVHVSVDTASGAKWAVLLSAVHAQLAALSPWQGMAAVGHTHTSAFQVPDLCAPFVGRDAALRALLEKVQPRGPTSVVALAGLPGVGKSQLAAQLLHHHRDAGTYTIVGWLRAQTVDAVEADLVALGTFLGVPDSWQGRRGSRALAVSDYLCRYPERGVLLVFDNARDYDALRKYFPGGALCRSVLTVRDRGPFPPDAVVPVGPFAPAEALALLAHTSGRAVDGERRAATALCAAVDYLPLAVYAFAVEIRASGQTCTAVLHRLRQDEWSVEALNTTHLAGYDHPESVVGSMVLVCRQLDVAGRRVLERLAVLAAHPVPAAVLACGAAAGRLGELGIVACLKPDRLIAHRLVRLVASAMTMRPHLARVAAGLQLPLLAYTDGFQQRDPSTWGPMAAVAPHVEEVLDKAAARVPQGELAGGAVAARWALMERLILYYECTAAWPAAERLASALLVEARPVVGDLDPLVLRHVHHATGCFDVSGDALEPYADMVRKKVAALGADHLGVAKARQVLAGLLARRGRLNDALALYRAVEGAKVAALGADHLSVAATRAAWADALASAGRPAAARRLYQAVERARVGALGADHPQVAAVRRRVAALSCRRRWGWRGLLGAPAGRPARGRVLFAAAAAAAAVVCRLVAAGRERRG